MTGTMRSPGRVVAVATTILALTALALALAPTAFASSASSARSGALHITKECSQDTGLADSFCTITASNVSAIAIGSRVVYFQDTTIATISDIALVVGPGKLTLGHVNLVGAGPGVVTLSGGTGTFAQFHARAVVSSTDPLGIVWHWDGTYRFGPD
jgi:hypothetical protein